MSISKDYKAREISGGELVDFGYRRVKYSFRLGTGFNFAKEKENKWDLNEVSIVPLREDEVMAILSATLVIGGKKVENVSHIFKRLKSKETMIGN